jgi:glutathione S-transferase
MKLFYSAGSPYTRKVLAAAIELNLRDGIELVPVQLSPIKVNEPLAAHNPLMKVPTLIPEDGEALFDSRVICEYLDSLREGPRLIPRDAARRWSVLRLQALADGLLDAAVLCRFENALRPEEKRWSDWVQGQSAKVHQALDMLDQSSELRGQPLNLGQIAIACALGWLEFRQPVGDIRASRSRLFDWYDEFAQRPSMIATVPKG